MRSVRQEYRRFREALRRGYLDLREEEEDRRRTAALFAKYGVSSHTELLKKLVLTAGWAERMNSSGTDAWRQAVERRGSEYR